ncbi:MAG: two-component system, OmpR family, response regulator [Kribbellaceae bacterium]|jgi:two-component system OmpR family response regulator|nr:two-component system, OmpR family, response regulator [Kribbellaceae bacterium]
MSERILVVEDEPYLADVLVTGLSFIGFDVKAVDTGGAALAAIHDFDPQLVLLDVMLPDTDGFELCRQIRATADRIGVVFLTARDAAEDTITGLSLGGDDYITKPFSLNEVVARARSVLRRLSPADSEPASDSVLRYADLELDDDRHEVRCDGVILPMAPTEFSLLRYLMTNAGRVMSKRQILQEVWRYDFHGDGRIIESYISYLRKKIDTEGRSPLIHTVRGVGYSLRSVIRTP